MYLKTTSFEEAVRHLCMRCDGHIKIAFHRLATGLTMNHQSKTMFYWSLLDFIKVSPVPGCLAAVHSLFTVEQSTSQQKKLLLLPTFAT